MKSYSVCAGIVAHNPKAVDINKLIDSLLSCARWVVVVDNNSADTSYLKDLKLRQELKVTCNAQNPGVSGGINQIIEYAR